MLGAGLATRGGALVGRVVDGGVPSVRRDLRLCLATCRKEAPVAFLGLQSRKGPEPQAQCWQSFLRSKKPLHRIWREDL